MPLLTIISWTSHKFRPQTSYYINLDGCHSITGCPYKMCDWWIEFFSVHYFYRGTRFYPLYLMESDCIVYSWSHLHRMSQKLGRYTMWIFELYIHFNLRVLKWKMTFFFHLLFWNISRKRFWQIKLFSE